MHRPFAILDEWVKQGRIRVSEERSESQAGRTEEAFSVPDDLETLGSDSELFLVAVRDVRPLHTNRGPSRVTDPIAIRPHEEEHDALRALREFCESGQVEPEHTREYVEHAAHPVGRLYLDDLRAGRFAIQAHLDLHGLTVAQARPVVEAFLGESIRIGYSCVRVIHGRGRHSAGRQPLMKTKVEQWLRHRRLARYVVAYTSARSVDGGGGAVYVLLRSGRWASGSHGSRAFRPA